MASKEAEIRAVVSQVMRVVNEEAGRVGGEDGAAVEAFRCCVLGLSLAYVWDNVLTKRMEAAKPQLDEMDDAERKDAEGFLVASTIGAMLQGAGDMLSMVSSEREASQKGKAN